MSKDFAGERDRLEHVIEDGEKQMRELEERIAIGDNRRALVEKYMNIEHLNRGDGRYADRLCGCWSARQGHENGSCVRFIGIFNRLS